MGTNEHEHEHENGNHAAASRAPGSARTDNLLLLADEMREMDRIAIAEFGVPGVVLMENAGRGAADVAWEMLAEAGAPADALVAIACGAGNNGGDGYVVARHLSNRGLRPVVYLFAPQEKIRGDARVHLDVLRKMQVPVVDVSADGAFRARRSELVEAALVVDGLLGTGLKSDVREPLAEAIHIIDAAGRPVLALDVPSGIDSDSGRVCGVAVRATRTVTFAFPKRGLYLYPGREHAAAIQTVDIGMPDEIPRLWGGSGRLLDAIEARRAFPVRAPSTHKGTYGELLIWAGSSGKAGAAVLAARAALRGGVGLCTVATTAAACRTVQAACVEAMAAVVLEDERGTEAAPVNRRAMEAALQGKSALCIGPGIGQSTDVQTLARAIIGAEPVPVIVDADGLNALAADRGVGMKALQGAPAPRVLTPHPGEMARLIDSTIAAVQADRPAAALGLAAVTRAHVVLKGASTLVAHPDGALWLCPAGNPGLATGGSGDVLAGLVGALLARGVDPGLAARSAVYVHAVAGDELAWRGGETGLVAGDLVDEIGAVVHRWETEH